jgi:hypothetical protein
VDDLDLPPMDDTQAWPTALEPERLITGHGRAVQGPAMREALPTLARDFDHVAVPDGGTSVETPATVERGSVFAPPR